MATQGPKIVQRVEISNQPSNINAISWSSDNRLAVLTNGCVAIVVSFNDGARVVLCVDIKF